MADKSPAISIPHVAKLANIPLNPEEQAYFENSFEPVMAYMQQIGELDVANVAETSRTSEEENVFREDMVTPSLTQEEALQNAKRAHQGYFVVSAILDKEE